jgi:hypothetical protein
MHSLLWLVFRFSSVKHKWWRVFLHVASHVAVLLEPATSKWLLMRGLVLSFFGGCCHAMKFPKGSPSSQVGHQNVPDNTSLMSHTVCPKFNSHVYKCKRWVSLFSTLHLAVQRGGSIGKCPSKILVMGQSIWPLFEKMKREHTPMN